MRKVSFSVPTLKDIKAVPGAAKSKIAAAKQRYAHNKAKRQALDAIAERMLKEAGNE